MGTAKGDGYTVTPRDLELVVTAINCTRLPFELEYDKLARRLNYKNPQSAKAAWKALRTKLDSVAEGATVAPSLIIDPEPLRRPAGTIRKGDRRDQGKRPSVASDESSSDQSETDGDDVPVKRPSKPSKKHKSNRSVDKDGDVPMRLAVGPSRKSGHKFKPAPLKPLPERRKRPRLPSASSSSGSSSAEAVETPRKKLKSKLQQLSVQTLLKDKGKKSAATLETEAYVSRQKALEAFSGRGGDSDEDDEEPLPSYVKKEETEEG